MTEERVPHSPMITYRWADTEAALKELRDYEGDPYDDLVLEYINPVNGDHVMPTMSFKCQMIRKGVESRAKRVMSSATFVVLEGEGYTEVGDERLEWVRNDVFAVPNWQWHRHVNTGKKDVVLYSVSDEPAQRKLGLYRRQGKTEAGEIVSI